MQNYNSKFKILPHTADLKIQVYGKTREGLFKNALLGMASALRAKIKDKKLKIKNKVKIKSLDLPALLVDFLSEALYLSQVNKESYYDVIFKKFTDTEIKGELIGQKVERFGEDIKAVTYHGLEIKQNKNGILELTILFDI